MPKEKTNKNSDKLQGKDKAIYVRNQKGHSIILAIIFGWVTLYILPIYWTFSKNHYWHA